jgi:hypothetical protein
MSREAKGFTMRVTSLTNPGLAILVFAAASAGTAFGAVPVRSETTTYVEGNLTGVTPQTGGTLLFTDENAMLLRTGLATIPVPYANITKMEMGGTQIYSHRVPAYKVWASHKNSKTQTQQLMISFKNEDGEEKSMTLELAPASANNVVNTINTHRGQPAAAQTAVAVADPAPAPETKLVAENRPPAGDQPSAEPTPAADTAPAPMVPTASSAKSTKQLKKEAAAQKKADKSKTEIAVVKPASPKPEWWGDDYWKTTRNASKWDQKQTASADAKAAADKAAADKPSLSQQ